MWGWLEGLGLKVVISKRYYIMGASDNDSLLGSSPGGGGLIPPAPILFPQYFYK